jgi:hypothetical protein
VTPGCYNDQDLASPVHRLLPHMPLKNKDPTINAETCDAACAAKNYTVGGLEAGHGCFCGNQLVPPIGPPQPMSDCCTPCIGNVSQVCGGEFKLLVFNVGQPPVHPPAECPQYGFCRHTKHSKPNNALPPTPNRTVPKWCPENASHGCNGTQPDDPQCCVGMACCRCSNDATMYNPTPKIFTEFDNFSFNIYTVCANEDVTAFPARPDEASGTKGNMRLVGVALPDGEAPAGGWPVVLMFGGAETKHNETAVFDPDKYCNINNKGCGVNITAPMLTSCHGPDGDPNAPPGWHLYSAFLEEAGVPWIDYPWHNLNFVSVYHARRLVRRLLLNGFAVVYPQSWGPGGWCVPL